MKRPMFNTPEAEALPTGMYLALVDGGDGPVIGPINWASATFGHGIDICPIGETQATVHIPVINDKAKMGNKLYDGWVVYPHVQRRRVTRKVKDERREK